MYSFVKQPLILGVLVILGSVCPVGAGASIMNGTFDSDLTYWTVTPDTQTELGLAGEGPCVVWDKSSQSALLLPYGVVAGLDTTYSKLSQAFELSEDATTLSFDVTMNIMRPGYETDVFSVVLNDSETVYQISSSQVNQLARSNDPQVVAKFFDGNGELQFALFKTHVDIDLSSYLEDREDDVEHEGHSDDCDHEEQCDQEDHEGHGDDYDHEEQCDNDDHDAHGDDCDHEEHGDDDDDHEVDCHDNEHEGPNVDIASVIIDLVFQLKNDNLDNCVSCVFIDNVRLTSKVCEDGDHEEQCDHDDHEGHHDDEDHDSEHDDD